MWCGATLQRFTECVEISLPEARQQVQTLSLTNVAPTFVSWNSDEAGWLLNLLENLPTLRSLLVHRCVVVNQQVVRCLSYGPIGPLSGAPTPKTWYLDVLSMTGLLNVTADCLAAALSCFPQLRYLDLSYSKPAGKHQFILQLCEARFILTLKILKLRGVGLSDRSMSSIAMCIGTGLWSLDVGVNNLTDVAIQALLDHCLLPPDYAYNPRSAIHATDRMSDCAQDDEEAHILRRPSDCQRNSGLTHLRIPNNDVSAEAIINLVRASRLVVLDCSREQGLGVHGYYRGETTRDADQAVGVLRQLAEDKFVSAGSLRYLKINHQLVTGDCAFLETSDKNIGATFKLPETCWPGWVGSNSQELVTDTALPTMGLRTLFLTGLPYASNTGWIAKGLLAFINHCALTESHATEDAANLLNNPKPQNTSNSQNEAESSSATDLQNTANPQNAAGPLVLTILQVGAEPDCPAYSSVVWFPENTLEPRRSNDIPSLEASEPAVEPQIRANPSSSVNTNTALARRSTRTTLRSLYIEIDRPPPADLGSFDMHEATRGDFSFFDADTASQSQTVPDEQPEENPWRGDLVTVLKAHKALAKHVWSGDLFAVYK